MGSLLSTTGVAITHLCPRCPRPVLQLASHPQGYERRREGVSVSNNIRIRIKDRRHRAAHSPHPQPFSALPTFPHCILGAHIYFLFIPTRGGGCLPNPNLERSGWNYLSWHNQIMAPFGFRSGIGCKVYHGSPSLPFPRAPFSRMELSTSPWLPFPDSTEAVFQKSSGSCVNVQRLWGSSLRKSYLPQAPAPTPQHHDSCGQHAPMWEGHERQAGLFCDGSCCGCA